jgi:hypothetical protein
MTTELRTLLEARKAEADRIKRLGHITPLVFFRLVAKGRGGEKQPKRIKAFTKRGARPAPPPGCPAASRTTCAGAPCGRSCAPASASTSR